jgi:DNA helicase-2/ATP-dependent DNA helicase PcrA
MRRLTMPEVIVTNPAEDAAQRALDEVFKCIRDKKSFRLEAGAGAGKTYSLIKALQLIIDEEGAILARRCQKVACITYTNVATEQVTKRTDANSIVLASTIHSFCWEICKSFQPALRTEVMKISPLADKIIGVGGIGARRIAYDLGHRHITNDEVLLHHDDVLSIMVLLMEIPKFRRILAARFPVLFIDEYQDTNASFAQSLIQHFVGPCEGPLIGLFGDSWQKIYKAGAGYIDHENLYFIGKKANFRSVSAIVNVLNRIRPDLAQEVSDPAAVGTVIVYHSNGFTGNRQTGSHWAGDLPSEEGHKYLSTLREKLVNDGWCFETGSTKILMLTHNTLATEQNYSRLWDIFPYNDSLLKKEDPLIAFLADTVEPACAAFLARRFGQMFSIIGRESGKLSGLSEKQDWARDMQHLVVLRETGTIGDVINLLKTTQKPILPSSVLEFERQLSRATHDEIQACSTLSQFERFRLLQYSEFMALASFINNHTPFATKHGVKGAEFENVLVVLGRGWNQYNWSQFLEWFPDQYPPNKNESYIRNRNLFYVACSRPKKNLVLLFTQLLSTGALATLERWFGAENIHEFNPT